jgi:hypothetical protein
MKKTNKTNHSRKIRTEKSRCQDFPGQIHSVVGEATVAHNLVQNGFPTKFLFKIRSDQYQDNNQHTQTDKENKKKKRQEGETLMGMALIESNKNSNSRGTPPHSKTSNLISSCSCFSCTFSSSVVKCCDKNPASER